VGLNSVYWQSENSHNVRGALIKSEIIENGKKFNANNFPQLLTENDIKNISEKQVRDTITTTVQQLQQQQQQRH